MKVEKQELVTRIYCDVCDRELTNSSRHCADDDTVHFCMKAPAEGRWQYHQGYGKSILVGNMPDCYDLRSIGVIKVIVKREGRP